WAIRTYVEKRPKTPRPSLARRAHGGGARSENVPAGAGAVAAAAAGGGVRLLQRHLQPGRDHAALAALHDSDAAADRPGSRHADRIPAAAARRSPALAHRDRDLGAAAPVH